MRKSCCFILLCFSCFSTVAQSVATVNGKPVSQKEFVWVFKKYRPDAAKPNVNELLSFLNVYIDLKLKVEDAISAGLEKDSAYVADIKAYETALLASMPVEAKNADYSLVINEYKQALLLYNISQTRVWERVEESDDAIEQYYRANKIQYGEKSFTKIEDQVTADYQRKVECDWIISLRNKFKVTIDQSLLARLAR